MKRVIITGANGFVGSNIVSVMIEQGWFVYAVDLVWDNPSVQTWDTSLVERITSTCVDLPSLSADALIHGAFVTASPESRNETPEANIRANLEPMLAIMEYANENHISRSVYLSSSGVYRSTPDTLIREDRPQSPLGVYAVAKTLMEHLVETMRTVYGRDIICVRLGNIYGPNEYQRPSRPFLSVVGRMIHMAVTEGQIVVHRPTEIREWTYAADIGHGILALLTTPMLKHALYHVASGEKQSNVTIAHMIQDLMGSVTIQIDDNGDVQGKALTRLGTLDNSRLFADTGFNNWTPMKKGLMLMNMVRGQTNA